MNVVIHQPDGDPVGYEGRYVVLGREGEVNVFKDKAQTVDRTFFPGEWAKIEVTP